MAYAVIPSDQVILKFREQDLGQVFLVFPVKRQAEIGGPQTGIIKGNPQ